MRTTLIIGGGLVLLGMCVVIARWLGGADAIRTAIGLFIPLWFILAAVNMWFGVYRVGYSFTEELPIFAIIFSIPALAAVWLGWRHV